MTNWARLKEPFPADGIEWRIGRNGSTNGKVWATCLAYVTARAIQDRLDEVFGVDGWKNEYRAGPSGGVVCRIYFRDSNGEWVWKEDGSGEMEASRGLSDNDASKGTLSSALKRAGSCLGVGRYLYLLEEGFAVVGEKGQFRAKTKEGETFYWSPPALPAWALPKDSHRAALDWIRQTADMCDDDVTMEVRDGGRRPVVQVVDEAWATVERDPNAAMRLVKAIEAATGQAFAL